MPTLTQPGTLVPLTAGPSSHGWHKMEAFAAGCPKEHQLRHVRGVKFRPMGADAPIFMHFAVGLLLHVARAQWLNDGYQGQLWVDAMKKFIADYPKLAGEKLPDGCYSTAFRTFQAYITYWKTAMKPKVLAVEYELKPRKFAPDAPDYVKRGARLDSIERLAGETWVGEFKSSYGGSAGVEDMYALHGQILQTMAFWGPEETKLFGPLAGVLLYPVKKATDKEKGKAYPVVKLRIERYASALEWFKKSYTTWLMQIQLIDWNASPERRMVCNRPFGPCEYRELCIRGRDGSLGYVLENGAPLHTWKASPGKEVPPWN